MPLFNGSRVVVAGKVDGLGGTFSGIGVSSIARIGIGDYDVTLFNPILVDDCAIVATPIGNAATVFVTHIPGGLIKKFRFNLAGAPVETVFSFIITRF